MKNIALHPYGIIGVAAISIAVASASQLTAPTAKKGGPQAQIPQRLRNLSDLQLLGRGFTLLERLEWHVRWLAEERRSPSPVSIGLGGGPIDSGYIQEQLIRGMAGGGDPRALRWLASSPTVRDRRMKVAFKLALGIFGDVQQHDTLVYVLRSDPDPHNRLLAAFGLACTLALDCRDALFTARNDPYYVTSSSGRKSYPVRKMAEDSLRTFEFTESRSSMKAKMKRFQEMIEDYDAFVGANLQALKRIAALANRSLAKS